MNSVTEYFTAHGDTVTIPRIDTATDTLISNKATFLIQLFVHVVLTGCASAFGIVANFFNIVIFLKQGVFTEYGTVGIFGLALSDMFCVVTSLWLSISEAIVLADPPNLSWSPHDVMYVTAVWPHIMFAQITRTVTVYVAFERCICVVFPFQVKVLLTPRRSLTIIALIFVVVACTNTPYFVAHQLEFVRDHITNSTSLIMVINPNIDYTSTMNLIYLNAYAFNIFSVVVVFTCTLITANRITLSKSWRESTTIRNSSKRSISSSQSHASKDNASQGTSKSKIGKEEKLVRKIIMISIIFLICYLPFLVYIIVITIDDEFSYRGKYNNFSKIMYSFTYLFETVNSSINIIIYYSMSSRYKEELKRFLGRGI